MLIATNNTIIIKGDADLILSGYTGNQFSFIPDSVICTQPLRLTANIYNPKLRLNTTDQQKTLVKDYIAGKNFFYGLKLDSSKIIEDDINNADGNFWFNSNNVCGKFVISKIDTKSFDDIQIADSCKM